MSQAVSNRGAEPTPWLAVFLTWVVPGGGHLYLGKLGWALGGFLVIEGIYALGVLLSGGMFLEYLPLEMRTPMAWVLTPEIGNLGALYWHYSNYGYGISGEPRPWPASMDVGTALTAASGILNLVLCSHAHLEARLAARKQDVGRARPLPAQAAALAWALPGLGQFLQGRRLRGALVFVSLVGLFVIGTWLAQGTNLDRERHFYYWAGQSLLGAPAFVVEFLHGHPRMDHFVPYADAGVVLGCVAGMLNVMAMLDAYGYSEDKLLCRDPLTPRGANIDEQGRKEAVADAAGGGP